MSVDRIKYSFDLQHAKEEGYMGVGDKEENGKPILLVYVDNENSVLAKKLETKRFHGGVPIKVVVSDLVVVDRIFRGAINNLIAGSLPLEKKIQFLVQQETKHDPINISKAKQLFIRCYGDEDGFVDVGVGTYPFTGEPSLLVYVDHQDSVLAKKLQIQELFKLFNGYWIEVGYWIEIVVSDVLNGD